MNLDKPRKLPPSQNSLVRPLLIAAAGVALFLLRKLVVAICRKLVKRFGGEFVAFIAFQFLASSVQLIFGSFLRRSRVATLLSLAQLISTILFTVSSRHTL